HHGPQLDDVGLKGYGKFQRNDFAGVQLTAEGGPDAILAEFIGSAPAGRRQPVTKHRSLYAHVEAITGETAKTPARFGRSFRGGVQPPLRISMLPLSLNL